jgi:DNA-binding LacI/PurR family transcriptional regulator/GAF domain-containing protein
MGTRPLAPLTARRTIGLLLDNTWDPIAWDVWAGAHDVAWARDVNLICVPGGALHSPIEFDVQANVLYDLIGADNVDGLIIWGGGLGQFVGAEEIRRLCEQYRPLPIVNAALLLEGIPSVRVNNYRGMREAVTHLIETHGYRRIGFIRGPGGHPEAEDRYHAYADTLAEHDIPLNPALVAPGEFARDSGEEAIKLLLDQRKLRPQVDIEAIAAVDDSTALGAMNALQARRIRVPEDIAVVGFDNVEVSWYATPPLTTVPSLAYDQSRRATEMVLALMDGEEIPEQVSVTTHLIVRQSCGCLDPIVAQTVAEPMAAANETFKAALAARREEILFEMVQSMGTPATGLDLVLAEQLADAFAAEMEDGSPGAFVPTVSDVVRQVVAARGNVSAWQGILSTLRRYALPHLIKDSTALLEAENLWQQARVMIGEEAERKQAYQAFQAQQQTDTLHEVGRALVTSTTIAELADVLARELPRLDIPSCYLSLYEDPESPTESSRLILAYDKGQRFELEADGLRFPSRQLAPTGVFRREDRHSMSLVPLYFGENQLGFALLEIGPQDARIHEPLRGQVSSALQGALLIQQVEERGDALQEANYAIQRRAIQLETSAKISRAVTSIFDMDQLLHQTVNLIRDSFDFYHVGIFLLTEIGDWAVLQEATGDAGEQMKAEGHRLAVDDNSMVGWTAAHREARIALYAEEDAVRFANPLLPRTRSEMTLPLAVGERVLGVLNVQSTHEAAFDEDDVRALQSMADQVAVAIENARRISDEAAMLEATSPVYRASRLLTTATATDEVASAIIDSVNTTGADGCLVVEFEFSPGGEPETLVYLGVWRQDREPQFQAGLRLPISDSPFPLEMVSSLWAVTDVEEDERLPESARAVFLETDARALVNIPLRSGEKVIGQVVVLRATPGPFPETALRLYEVLSDQAAVALERAQLLDRAQRLAAQEQRTRQMIDRIRQAADVEQTLRTTAAELSQAMDVPHVSIELSLEAPEQE